MTKPLDGNAVQGTTPIAKTISVPLGISVLARVNQVGYQNNTGVYVYSPLITAETANEAQARVTGIGNHTDDEDSVNQFDVLTNTSSQIMAVAIAGGSSLVFITIGWTDYRGRE